MQIVKYSDPYSDAPYGTTLDIVLPDDTPADVIREVQAFLDDDYRRIKSDERAFDRHTYELEGRRYEGSDHAYRKTPEWIYLHNEQQEQMISALDQLTGTQRRRFGMLWDDGLSIREIARIEEADYKSVRESIVAAQKKLKKAIDNSYEEEPDFDEHHDRNKYGSDGEDDLF